MFSLSVPDIPDRDILNRKDFAMKYTDLIFDLYGTLVDIHTDQTKEEVWAPPSSRQAQGRVTAQTVPSSPYRGEAPALAP